MNEAKYTNDLDGYIENMKMLEHASNIKGEAGMLACASFARKTAEEFKKSFKYNDEKPKKDARLRMAVINGDGKWPSQLSSSGVMFYDGLRITIEDFREESIHLGYNFGVK